MKEKFFTPIVTAIAGIIASALVTAFTPLGDVLREFVFPTSAVIQGYILRGQAPTLADIMLDGNPETARATDSEGQFFYDHVRLGEHCYSIGEGGQIAYVDSFYVDQGATKVPVVAKIDLDQVVPSSGMGTACFVTPAPPPPDITPTPLTTGAGAGATPALVEAARAAPTFQAVFRDLREIDESERLEPMIGRGDLALSTMEAVMTRGNVEAPWLASPQAGDGPDIFAPTPSAAEVARILPTFEIVFADLRESDDVAGVGPILDEGDLALVMAQDAVRQELGTPIASPVPLDYSVSLEAAPSGTPAGEAAPGLAPNARAVAVRVAAAPEVKERIARVTYYLDPSLSPSVVTRYSRDDDFALSLITETPFELTADVQFADGHVVQLKTPIAGA